MGGRRVQRFCLRVIDCFLEKRIGCMLRHYNVRIEDIDSYDTFPTHSRATITSKKKFVRILCRSPITKKLLRL